VESRYEGLVDSKFWVDVLTKEGRGRIMTTITQERVEKEKEREMLGQETLTFLTIHR
jgi:hypothetical protein